MRWKELNEKPNQPFTTVDDESALTISTLSNYRRRECKFADKSGCYLQLVKQPVQVSRSGAPGFNHKPGKLIKHTWTCWGRNKFSLTF